MKTRLIRIGNSRGIRLPKPLLTQAGLSEEVELQIQDGSIVISRSLPPRSGWAEAAKTLNEHQQDRLLDEARPTRFDKEEWSW
jgi:antitoxin MazE